MLLFQRYSISIAKYILITWIHGKFGTCSFLLPIVIVLSILIEYVIYILHLKFVFWLAIGKALRRDYELKELGDAYKLRNKKVGNEKKFSFVKLEKSRKYTSTWWMYIFLSMQIAKERTSNSSIKSWGLQGMVLSIPSGSSDWRLNRPYPSRLSTWSQDLHNDITSWGASFTTDTVHWASLQLEWLMGD